eukprot:CAMPEP_0175428144 /NCGR_PEP_ID=MMETSP0095-20121207/50701_1 /TAXON_ID=311494 /ORGANISM="Alexandrium monilatum, Strain CCMP3105" /LENGTH=46 /DNA_ID= /DNA_START= /DNA_END= /DNA_ORIENTATION=
MMVVEIKLNRQVSVVIWNDMLKHRTSPASVDGNSSRLKWMSRSSGG